MDPQGGLFGDEPPPPPVTLADRFVVPPFSVLDARQGYWQERKRAWLGLGLESEVGRTENALNLSDQCEDYRKRGGEYETTALSQRFAPGGGGGGAWLGGPRTSSSERFGNTTENKAQGTSIFDPVLCELAYRWFSPPRARVLDPFAGGSVRGIVAAILGRSYEGVELRTEQVHANREQAARITPLSGPRWIEGDSVGLRSLVHGAFDFVFSCPPYADLERYSDDPRDLSTLDYPRFLTAYRWVIAQAVDLLVPDRFACFVVGDLRDKRTGLYRNFVSDTVKAFAEAGAALYNEAVFLTPVGSLPIRIGKQFSAGRKLGKSHQNVLVFVKGDPRRAASACEEAPAEEHGEQTVGGAA